MARRSAAANWWRCALSHNPADPLLCGVLKNGTVVGKPLSDKPVARLVKESAVKADLPERFSGHSLRAGLSTAADVACKYLRSRGRRRNHVTEKLFLPKRQSNN